MKGVTMAGSDWRTVQIYLSENGIAEVEVDIESSSLRCNCEMHESRKTCKHVRMVESKMKKNGGTYPVQISSRATESETRKANKNSKEFRSFVIKYGKIEVL